MSYDAWNRRQFIRTMAAAGALTSIGRAGHAAVPETIRIVIGYAPGGASDALIRVLAAGLARRNKWVVVPENKPGAGGLLSMQATKIAPADGSVLLSTSAASIIQSLSAANRVRLDRDFAPVIISLRGYFTLFSNASVPVTSLKELIAFDKANPGKLSYASFGVGSQLHLAMELLKQKTGMTITHVPYKSSSESMASVLKNETQISFTPYSGIRQHIEAGRLRALAVSSKAPSEFAPGVPSMQQAGLDDYEVAFWFGLNAPAGTPEATLELLNKELNVVLREPATQTVIREQFGAQTLGGSREDFARVIATETKMYDDLIRTANIRLEG
ncbi:MAG: Bug family tripartite tricarboxylate transporter substrate binding protein [Lautropia sp.]